MNAGEGRFSRRKQVEGRDEPRELMNGDRQRGKAGADSADGES